MSTPERRWTSVLGPAIGSPCNTPAVAGPLAARAAAPVVRVVVMIRVLMRRMGSRTAPRRWGQRRKLVSGASTGMDGQSYGVGCRPMPSRAASRPQAAVRRPSGRRPSPARPPPRVRRARRPARLRRHPWRPAAPAVCGAAARRPANRPARPGAGAAHLGQQIRQPVDDRLGQLPALGGDREHVVRGVAVARGERGRPRLGKRLPRAAVPPGRRPRRAGSRACGTARRARRARQAGRR